MQGVREVLRSVPGRRGLGVGGGADGVDLVEGERLGCAADHEEFHCFAGVIEDS
ncbi:MAG: hypothetical protein RI897_2183, partial [Verrucomicrobiota bacterium]